MFRCGSMDNKRTENTASILSRIVRVVPGWTIKIGSKWIREARSWWYRALLNTWDAIHPSIIQYQQSFGLNLQTKMCLRRSLLQKAMPMKWQLFRRTFDPIVDRDLYSVAPVRLLVISLRKSSSCSYQLASIKGPGNCPLTKMTSLVYPSGALLPLWTVKSYVRMTLIRCQYSLPI